jgi:hypothetical protein
VATVRRPRTNTPLQALSTLNDPAFVDAARGLARRLMREAPSDPRARAAYGFRLCVARPPGPAELQVLLDGFHRERDHFASDPRAARQSLGDAGDQVAAADLPELAAWTVVANALLNLDETLTKE